MKQKHFHKGIEQLVQEGAIQYYKALHTNQIIIGAVGQLQFEVFEHRLKMNIMSMSSWNQLVQNCKMD